MSYVRYIKILFALHVLTPRVQLCKWTPGIKCEYTRLCTQHSNVGCSIVIVPVKSTDTNMKRVGHASSKTWFIADSRKMITPRATRLPMTLYKPGKSILIDKRQQLYYFRDKGGRLPNIQPYNFIRFDSKIGITVQYLLSASLGCRGLR